MLTRKIGRKEIPAAIGAAVQYVGAGRYRDAADLCRQVLRVDKQHGDALHLLGLALDRLGETQQAKDPLERAVRADPAFATYRNSLGVILRKLGRFDAAEAAYRKALALNPSYAEAHGNLANLLRHQGRLPDALPHAERAVALQPHNLQARNTLAGILRLTGEMRRALQEYEEALRLAPGHFDTRCNLADLLMETGELAKGIELLRRVTESAPDEESCRSDYLMQLNYLPEASPEFIAQEHRRLGALHHENYRGRPDFDLDPERPLRIGLVSPDFRAHPVTAFLKPALAQIDREHYRIHCYHTHPDRDAVTDEIAGMADSFHDCRALDDGSLASLVEKDGIDILIDLAGHSARNRLALFALQPAPLLATWLGYFHTTGIPTVDFIIADRFMVPPGEEGFFVEEVLRLPDCRFSFAPPPTAPEVAPLPLLQSGHLTFGSFNNIRKLNPAVCAAWGELLGRIPGSRLIMKWHSLADPAIRDHVVGLFSAAGISAERLDLRSGSPHAEMLRQYGEIDIALDPFPFGGGLTSAEALWMGVPVLTLLADRPAGRQTAAFLEVIGLGEMVAATVEEFVEKGVALAADTVRLAGLRAGMRERMLASPLCDGVRFARNLEELLRGAWRKRCVARGE